MPGENLYLRSVINASGKMTALGGSAVSPEVAREIADAAGKHVVIQELLAEASKAIAGYTGAEAGCVTCGAAAGIAISVAATIAGDNQSLVETIPCVPTDIPNEIILMKGHSINFGAPIIQMVALGGGKVREIGQSNSVTSQHLEQAITAKTAAVLFVKSHHAVQKGMLAWEEVIRIAGGKGIPVIIDAAAEEDLHKYVSAGADLVIYSGGKAVGGPTSGFICGRRKLVQACLAQYRGIGRAMKTGKENIMGLVAALDRYANLDYGKQKTILHRRIDKMLAELDQIEDVSVAKIDDEAGRSIPRAELRFSSPELAAQIVKRLEAGNPALFTRNHYLNLGSIFIDPRPLQEEDCDKIPYLIIQALEEINNG